MKCLAEREGLEIIVKYGVVLILYFTINTIITNKYGNIVARKIN